MFTWFAKASTAFIAGGVVVLSQAIQGSSASGDVITQGEWLQAAVAAVLAGVAVFSIPNRTSNGPN